MIVWLGAVVLKLPAGLKPDFPWSMSSLARKPLSYIFSGLYFSFKYGEGLVKNSRPAEVYKIYKFGLVD